MARLARSAREIGMRLAETPERIEAIERELIERNGLTEGVVYLQATRGAEEPITAGVVVRIGLTAISTLSTPVVIAVVCTLPARSRTLRAGPTIAPHEPAPRAQRQRPARPP